MSEYHNPVLLKTGVDALIDNPDGVYIDCTFGGGGHSVEILSRLSEKGKLYAFDQDADAENNKISDSRFVLISQNFRFIKNYLRFYNITQVDGIFADLGVSSHQFDIPERGFSTRFEGPLDMRMNTLQSLTAEEVINTYDEVQLAEVLSNYGELQRAMKVAKEIIKAREGNEIKTTQELKNIFNYIPEHKKNKFFAQLFQALRIEVNDEMNALKQLLEQSLELLNPGGKLVFISYHSLEDRLVKRFIKTGLFFGEPERDIYGNWNKPFDLPTSKAIIPSEEEIKENSRARSAKMRVAIKR